MSSTILLKDGKILIHDETGHVIPRTADLLIQDSVIADIQENLSSSGATVIDCSGKILSPGFIDTHHHVWQTQLRGTHADETLLEYFYQGNFVNSLYSPRDIFWGQLGGCLEMIDAGTTTVVDHASLTYSPEHPREAIRATIASGIRSVFAYCPTPRVATWKPSFTLEQDILPPWVMATWDDLVKLNPFGPNGRVRLGFAFDGLWLPPKILQDLFTKVREQGSQLITAHAMSCAIMQNQAIEKFSAHGLLSSDVLLSHNNHPTSNELRLLRSSGAHISSTPSTELQMGHGDPVCLEPGFMEHSSLGVDCHSSCSAFMPSQMMLALQAARGARNRKLENQGKWPASVGPRVEDVFNHGTILGAKAIGLGKEIGSLQKGKKADIVIFEGTTPNMVAAAQRDPVAAIVLHSSIRDVSTVIVDGVIRKHRGKLLEVKVSQSINSDDANGGTYAWEDVAREIAEGAQVVDQKKQQACDPSAARKGIMEAFYINPAAEAD